MPSTEAEGYCSAEDHKLVWVCLKGRLEEGILGSYQTLWPKYQCQSRYPSHCEAALVE